MHLWRSSFVYSLLKSSLVSQETWIIYQRNFLHMLSDYIISSEVIVLSLSRFWKLFFFYCIQEPFSVMIFISIIVQCLLSIYFLYNICPEKLHILLVYLSTNKRTFKIQIRYLCFLDKVRAGERWEMAMDFLWVRQPGSEFCLR